MNQQQIIGQKREAADDCVASQNKVARFGPEILQNSEDLVKQVNIRIQASKIGAEQSFVNLCEKIKTLSYDDFKDWLLTTPHVTELYSLYPGEVNQMWYQNKEKILESLYANKNVGNPEAYLCLLRTLRIIPNLSEGRHWSIEKLKDVSPELLLTAVDFDIIDRKHMLTKVNGSIKGEGSHYGMILVTVFQCLVYNNMTEHVKQWIASGRYDAKIDDPKFRIFGGRKKGSAVDLAEAVGWMKDFMKIMKDVPQAQE